MFLPMTLQEMEQLGWERPDVILVCGDAYIDSPYNGVALLGHQLAAAGYRVGVISQPDVSSESDISRLGEPILFWGVSAGAVDSMVANTTALGKPRKLDDHTPGGQNNRRPNRATIVYTNLIKRVFKDTVPVVLGGVEASLRRVAHYDFWTDRLRRSVLLDAKADYLLYGMADLSILELAQAIKEQKDPKTIRGLCYASAQKPEDVLELPSWEDVQMDKAAFTRMFHIFYANNDAITARRLVQRYGERYVVQNPPARPLTTQELDAVYALPYEHAVHPFDLAQGDVRAMETIRFSIPTHRGCYGECNFCAIAVHEGRRVSWRSEESILAEAEQMRGRPGFKGIIYDLSGPTANMYGFECRIKSSRGACANKRCIYPAVCSKLGITHAPAARLMRRLREVPGVKKVFIGSGIRHDMLVADKKAGREYLQELARHHVSGQLKLAPEHSEPRVLARMGKPGVQPLLTFKREFEKVSEEAGKTQFLTYYIIAAYPGCTNQDMINLQNFASQSLGILPEQTQIFTPTPSTYASVMYYTERDPWTGEPLFVEKSVTGKMQQKALISGWRGQGRSPQSQKGKNYMTDNYQDPSGDLDEYERVRRLREEPQVPGAGQRKKRPYARKSGFTKPNEPPKETRVVRDDYGHFFNNRRPEGWVDKRKPDRAAPREGSRGYALERPRRQSGGYTKPNGEYGQERGENQRPPRREGEWKPRERSESSRSYKRDGEWKPREQGEGSRPYRKPGEGYRSERSDRPYRPRTERPAGSTDKPFQSKRRYQDRQQGGAPGADRNPYTRPEKPGADRKPGSWQRPDEHKPYKKPYQGSRGTGKPDSGRKDQHKPSRRPSQPNQAQKKDQE